MFTKKFASKLSALFSNRRRKAVGMILSLMLMFCLLTSFVVLKLNFVTVFEDGEQIASFTTIRSEQDALMELAGIEPAANDTVNMSTEGQKITINISRAFAVSVHDGDNIITVMAHTDATAEDVLALAQVSYTDSDKLSCKSDDLVTPGMEITLTRCTSDTVKVIEILDYETVKKNTDTLYKGTTKVSQAGKAGEKTLTYKVNYENGVEVSRTLVSETVTNEPQDEIILVGTKVKAKVSSSSGYGQKLSAEQLEGATCLTVTATAYCNTSDGGQRTALGTTPCYGTVAVDPRVIPLGTKLYITSADGSYVYGYCIAGDTGGAIKGNRVDLFLGNESECRSFGRRQMLVYILD